MLYIQMSEKFFFWKIIGQNVTSCLYFHDFVDVHDLHDNLELE